MARYSAPGWPLEGLHAPEARLASSARCFGSLVCRSSVWYLSQERILVSVARPVASRSGGSFVDGGCTTWFRCGGSENVRVKDYLAPFCDLGNWAVLATLATQFPRILVGVDSTSVSTTEPLGFTLSLSRT